MIREEKTLEREREEKALEKEREHRERMIEKEIELARVKEGKSGDVSTSGTAKARAPKLPVFNEKEGIDSYIERFERFASLQRWPKEELPVNFSALLTGGDGWCSG